MADSNAPSGLLPREAGSTTPSMSSSSRAAFDANPDVSDVAASRTRAEAESDLLPSPPSTPLAGTSVTIVDQRRTPPPTSTSNEGADRDAPGGELDYSNVDGTMRVYRFPQRLPSATSPRPQSTDGTSAGKRERNGATARMVTVRNLRNKSCWICSEEDEEDASTAGARGSASTRGAAGAGGAGSRRRRFVHPCNCTLVAHESCLLAWIDQSRINHPSQETVTCPQCKAPYILVDSQPLLLRLFERADKLISKAVPIGCISVLGGSILIAASAYGCVALRLTMGREASQRLLARPWPWHFWFDIPIIPFALVASKLRVAESATTWIPTVLVYSLNQFPITTTNWFIDTFQEHGASSRRYPPGPTMMALLIPWIRQFYLALKRRTYRAVLAPFLRKRRADRRTNDGNGGAGTPTAGANRRQRVVVVGDDNYLQDADPAPTMGLQDALQGDNDYDDGGEEGTGGGGADEQGTARTIFISHCYVGRLCLNALSLPLVANVMGKLLALFARRSSWLATVLGMEPFLSRRSSGKRSILSSFYTTTASESARKPRSSPIGGLLQGRIPNHDDDYEGGEEATAALRRRLGLAPMTTYDDLDPVWFRNVVGAALFIFVKDAASLLHKYLKLRQRGKTRVADLPFGPGLVEGLDLVKDA